MALVDLHIHSSFSDGLCPVDELVQKASGSGLAGFSLTDHDTFDGIDETVAVLKKRNSGLFFLAGCEFSTHTREVGELHVLAYFSTGSYRKMNPMLAGLRKARIERAYKMIERLKEKGMPIAEDSIMKGNDVPVGRMHIARELVRLGYYSDTDKAFENMLRAGAPGYIARDEVKTVDILRAIKDNGGKSVLAHPTMLYKMKNWVYINDLIKAGLDGIEFLHPKINQDLSRQIEASFRGKLILTGGSDYHDDHGKSEMGKFGIPLEEAQKYFANFTDI